MRIVAVCALALILGTCVTTEEQQRLDVAAEDSKQCVVRETIAVAQKPIDLETATLAVMARCHYPDAIEKAVGAKWEWSPAASDGVRRGFERVDFKEAIKLQIARLRAEAAR
jgi:hypothetical protein